MSGPDAPTRRAFLSSLGALGVGSSILLSPSGAGAARSAPAPGPARTADADPADVVHRWVDVLYDAMFAEGPTPPAAARFYALCSVAMYEAAVPGMPRHRSLAGQLRGLTALPNGWSTPPDWPTVVSASVHAMALALLPSATQPTIDALDAAHADVLAGRRTAGVPAGMIRVSDDRGRSIGSRLASWAANDGYAGTLGRAYTPPVGDALWVPTPPNFGTAIEPYWAEVRPMILAGSGEVEPEVHVPFSVADRSPFRLEAETVYRTSQSLTDEQRAIARFWTDNPRSSGLPSGHWHQIASDLGQARSLHLADALEVQVRTGIALHDAFLDCWAWKYRFNLLRPVTYVQRHIDPTWTTFVNSPQFPEYTSGHSVASAAAATVLTALFGPVSFVDDTHHARGLPARHFASIRDAAEEAAMSRLYGGIHYPMAISAGLDQGRTIGDLVLTRLVTRR